MGYLRFQFTSLKSVQIDARWSQIDRCFYIDSCVGQIRYKPKTTNELTAFRDKYINQVDLLRNIEMAGRPVTRKLFNLYREIKKNHRVRYKANIHTRVKGLLFYAF